MECIFTVISAGIGLTSQACCWWHCFRYCGWIEDREVIQTERPPIIVINNNPFKNPNIQKDLHLDPAYY